MTVVEFERLFKYFRNPGPVDLEIQEIYTALSIEERNEFWDKKWAIVLAN